MHSNTSFGIFTALFMTPGLALSHTGHVADLAGHDHIVAGIAIGVAIAVGVIGVLTDKTGKEDADGTDENDSDEQVEAEA